MLRASTPVRTPQVMSAPMKLAAGPFVFSLRNGEDAFAAAAYGSAAVHTPEEVMNDLTLP